MCGYEPMAKVHQYREAVRKAYPAGSCMRLGLIPSNSGRSVLVYVGGERADGGTQSLFWGYAVIRTGAYELRIRLPKELVNMREFVALKINQAIWGNKQENYYTFYV